MTSERQETNQPSGLWYGWVILGVVFIAMCTLVGIRASFGIFFKEIAGEFGWSRAQTAGAFSAGLISQAIASPFSGWLADNWGIRRTMATGVFIFGAALFFGSLVGSLWQLYLVYAVLCVGFSGGTWVVQVPALSNWFVKRRGLALGIANTAQGASFALNIIVPPLLAALGWRMSYVALSGAVLLFAFPVTWLLLRDRPSEKGTVADAPFLGGEDARPPGKRGAGPAPPRAAPPPGVASRQFLFLLGTSLPIAYIFTALLVHMVPHATDQGFTPAVAATLFALWGVAQVAGNLASTVSDRIGRTATVLAGAACGVLSSFLIATYAEGDAPALFTAGAILSGLALGLIRPTVSVLIADHFSGPGFGRINGMHMTGFALFGATAPWVTGALFDADGSYRTGFLILAAMFLLSAGSAALLGRAGRAARQRRGAG